MVVIGSFKNPLDADIAYSTLEDADFAPKLDKADSVIIVKIPVTESTLEEARELLQNYGAKRIRIAI